MFWRQDVAQQVVEEILYANAEGVPKTQDEWKRVAERFGLKVIFHDHMPVYAAGINDNVAQLPTPGILCPISHPVYAHELAEAAMVWEGTPPYQYQPTDTSDVERHRIARMVEGRIEEERQAERLRLEAERAQEEPLVRSLSEQVRALSQQMMQYAQAALESVDFFGLTPPDGNALRHARMELQRHTEILSGIEARLHCI